MIDYDNGHFSDVARTFTRSEIRELLKLVGQPGFISFAGGLPSPRTFDVKLIKELACNVLDTNAAQALQYSPTEGTPQLIRSLRERAAADGIDLEDDNILVTTASQQGLDLVAKAFLNPGDRIICGIPTYLGAIHAFRTYQARFIGVHLDPETGIDTDEIEGILRKEREGIKFIYVVPDFQNPAGVTISHDKRLHLLEMADKYDIPVIEDSPYRKLRYTGKPIPSLLSLDEGQGRVLMLKTFSKIFVPGFRLGWAMGPKPVIEKMTIAKQAVDLCTPAFNQLVAAEFIDRGHLDTQIENNIKLYSRKQKSMLEALSMHMPQSKDIFWTKPEGGLFLWASLPAWCDTTELLKKAIEKRVAYVIGNAFDPVGGSKNCMRINFSYPDEDMIFEGVERLADVIKAELSAGTAA